MTDLFNQDDKSDVAAYIPGEQGRYKTVEDLAKGKYEGDLHIKNIERENAELRASNLSLREDNMMKAKLEELISKLDKPTAEASPASNGNNPTARDAQPFNLESLESKFNEWTKKYDVTRTRENNARAVQEALKERYGSNYMEALNKQTEELGLTKEAVNYLAETAPKAFFKTLGLDQAPSTDPFVTPPRHSPSFSPKGEPERTWSYYQKMRKEQPTLYNSPKIQDQMMKDYQNKGKAFEDGDFLAYGQSSAF